MLDGTVFLTAQGKKKRWRSFKMVLQRPLGAIVRKIEKSMETEDLSEFRVLY